MVLGFQISFYNLFFVALLLSCRDSHRHTLYYALRISLFPPLKSLLSLANQKVPHNKVEYYVSYFDYYQPEAYKPATDIYIGKKVQRNANIAKMRLKTLNSLVTDRHVIVVASVAAIYGCFNPASYRKVVVDLKKGQKIDKDLIKEKLFLLGYKNDKKINPGSCQVEEKKICFMLG